MSKKKIKKDLYRKLPDPNDPNEIQGYPNPEDSDIDDHHQKRIKDLNTDKNKKTATTPNKSENKAKL